MVAAMGKESRKSAPMLLVELGGSGGGIGSGASSGGLGSTAASGEKDPSSKWGDLLGWRVQIVFLSAERILTYLI